MKKLFTVLILLLPLVSGAQLINGNPELVPVEGNPGSHAQIIEIELHSKIVPLNVTKYKETLLGYGTLTGKILIPELAEQSLLNHRNDGEEAPCLSGPSKGMKPIAIDNTLLPEIVPVEIKVLNEFHINQEKRICKVILIESVEAEVQGVRFRHRLVKDNGFRYIKDCPIK
jgi:hypothetical protein